MSLQYANAVVGAYMKLPPEIKTILTQITETFAAKNRSYRTGGCWYGNFLENEPVRRGLTSPVEYAAILCSKQDSAVWAAIQEPSEAKLRELPERLVDGIVYRIIMLAMLNQREEGNHK